MAFVSLVRTEPATLCPKCEIGFCGPRCSCSCHKSEDVLAAKMEERRERAVT